MLYLRVIRSLVSPKLPTNVSTPSRRMVRNCSLLSLLLNLIMGQGVPETVLTEIIITVAECIRGQPESQTDFSSLEAPLTPPRPAMVVLLMSMVNKKQPLALRHQGWRLEWRLNDICRYYSHWKFFLIFPTPCTKTSRALLHSLVAPQEFSGSSWTNWFFTTER